MKGTVLLVFAAAALGLSGNDNGVSKQASGRGGGLVTLYADDPVAHTFNFAEGTYGAQLQDCGVKLCGADLDVEAWNSGEFTVGIECRKPSSILDLGSTEELRARYGFEERVGGGLGFASIRVVQGRFEILKNLALQKYQPLLDGKWLVRSPNHAPILDDHVYLVRLPDADEPGETVTLRWECLD
jgi:hypothetical protein